MIGVGVVGYGYWGPNLVRNFMELASAELVAVCDARPERLKPLAKRCPSVKTTTSYADLLADPRIQAIAVATPVGSHYDLALQALRAGKHVLVEKPLASSSSQVKELIAEAEKRKLVLMVDHTFVYTGAIRKMRELVTSGQLGDLYYYDSVRVNLGLFQPDVNVIWDLAVHDLSIMDYVIDKAPVAVSATGISHVPGKPENTAYLTMFFASNMIAHVHVNWLAPVKIRRTLLGGSLKMAVYDDLEPSEKVKVYNSGITLTNAANSSEDAVHQMLISYRTGDMWAPQLDVVEALRTELTHFIQCIETGSVPTTDGQAGLRLIRILEAANRSMALRGQTVDLAV